MSSFPEQPGNPIFFENVGRAGEGRIARSWRLTKVAWSVIRREPTLLGLAVLQTVFNLLGSVVLFMTIRHVVKQSPSHVSIVNNGYTGGAARVVHTPYTDPHFWVTIVLGAWLLTAIGSYFGVALASGASRALRGQPTALKECLKVANSRIGDILIWSLIATLVGLVLRLVVERLGLAGRLVSAFIGIAWAIATFFAIPAIALEGCSGGSAAKRSAQLVKRKWGERISGSVIIGLATAVAMIPIVIVGIVGMMMVGGSSPGTGFLLMGLAIAAFAGLTVVSNAVRQVFAVALYRYVRDGEALGFAEADLVRPFAPKRGRS